MKSVIRTLGVLVLALIATAAISWSYDTALAGAGGSRGADSAGSAGGYKIGVVNRKQAFDDYEKQQAAWSQLEQELQAKQAEADRQSEAVEAQQEKLQNDTSLTPQQREELALQIQEARLDYETAFKKLQNEIDVEAAKFFANTMKEVDQAIKEIGAEENYHLILESDPNPRSGTAVLYFTATIDITSKVVDRLNSR